MYFWYQTFASECKNFIVKNNMMFVHAMYFSLFHMNSRLIINAIIFAKYLIYISDTYMVKNQQKAAHKTTTINSKGVLLKITDHFNSECFITWVCVEFTLIVTIFPAVLPEPINAKIVLNKIFLINIIYIYMHTQVMHYNSLTSCTITKQL